MRRRSFVTRALAAVGVGVVGVMPPFSKADVLATAGTPVKCLLPEGHIPTPKDFHVVLSGGQEEFRVMFQTYDNRVISEEAPFDKDDPLSYVLVELIMTNPMLRIYMVSGWGRKHKIIPFVKG